MTRLSAWAISFVFMALPGSGETKAPSAAAQAGSSGVPAEAELDPAVRGEGAAVAGAVTPRWYFVAPLTMPVGF